MNQKELREIRKRFTLDKDSISHVYGCYVNAAKDIVARMDMSMGLMEQEEAELYLKLLKKSISGTLGKNLLDIEFSTKQVENSDEHRLLQALRQSHLRDEDMRELFYKRVIESLDFGDDSYVILLASDSYDIPFKGRDDELWEEGSNEVFDYIICCICPVKDARASLRYFAEEQNFRGASSGHVLGNPELGFMFPSFADRSTNIYNALYYSRGLVDIHHEFIDGIFHIEKSPMSAGAQQHAFTDVLCESLGEDCSLDVVKAVHGQIRQQLLVHKESKDPEVPELFVEDLDDVLKHSGVPEEKVEIFNEACRKEFGDQSILNPINVMESKKFEMKTPEVKITVDPEYTYLITTQEIDGSQYLLIPAGEGVTVNGIDISVGDGEEEPEEA
ncbi:MAG: DUF4317 domain-containing protein [Clostridia bacterium]|nr:DUF4317 domain-containing protein [Clostridia bacterium]